MIEKRRTRRIKDEKLVKIMPISEDEDQANPDEETFYHLTKDISMGGIKIQSSNFFQINTLLNMELFLEDLARFIRIIGEVRWIKNNYANELFEMGIEFVALSPYSFKVLNEHIEKLEM